VALGLGSNLGDRRGHLERAVAQLRRSMEVEAVSTLRETRPEGGPPQGPFLNGAAVVGCDLAPRALLAALQALERKAGRRPGPRWGPRPLDLDILLCDDRIVSEPGLRVPHPRLATRLFVLEPLAEIAADWKVPGTGRTVGELFADLRIHS
jgi:2-amino-4-hydroxy-6-hydroxymethyldihydropteridine diphosphokinase